jgi:hypothetical protein
MGKRLIRILKDKIPELIPQLLGQEINLVFKNNVTLHGKILKLKGDSFTFQDMILRKHQILISDLSQILKDEESDW